MQLEYKQQIKINTNIKKDTIMIPENGFKQHYTFVYDPSLHEEGQTEGESRTIPGMALTVPEMIARLNRGQSVPTSQNYYPEDEDEIIIPSNESDLTDLDNYKQKLEDVQERLAKKQQKIVFSDADKKTPPSTDVE